MDEQNKIEEARAMGRFEGQVMTSLADIKGTVNEIKTKQNSQDVLISQKVDKTEIEAFEHRLRNIEKKLYIGTGILIAAQVIVGIITTTY